MTVSENKAIKKSGEIPQYVDKFIDYMKTASGLEYIPNLDREEVALFLSGVTRYEVSTRPGANQISIEWKNEAGDRTYLGFAKKPMTRWVGSDREETEELWAVVRTERGRNEVKVCFEVKGVEILSHGGRLGSLWLGIKEYRGDSAADIGGDGRFYIRREDLFLTVPKLGKD